LEESGGGGKGLRRGQNEIESYSEMKGTFQTLEARSPRQHKGLEKNTDACTATSSEECTDTTSFSFKVQTLQND